jgi:hypothetical protein
LSVDGRQTQACRIINEPHKKITAASEARGHDDCLDASAAGLTWDESLTETAGTGSAAKHALVVSVTGKQLNRNICCPSVR